jgi:hypothetical protein
MIKFPDEKPLVNRDDHGWFDDRNKSFLKNIITKDTKIIVELGSWLGTSTRWFCENSNANIFCVDHWLGSNEHQNRRSLKQKLPILYETFIVNCWEYKNRIIPIRMNTIAGMHYISDNNISPDIIFIDASHEYDDVLKDLNTAHTLFPNATLTGDDFSWKNRSQNKRFTVREALLYFAKHNKLNLSHNNRNWLFKK